MAGVFFSRHISVCILMQGGVISALQIPECTTKVYFGVHIFSVQVLN